MLDVLPKLLLGDWSSLNLAESQIPCKLAKNFSKCQRLLRDFVLRKFRGGGTSQKIHPVICVIAASAWKVHIVKYGLARLYSQDNTRKTLVSTGWKDQ